jgi:spermidine dehydrogenase
VVRPGDAGRADERVDAAELARGRGGRALDGLRVGDVQRVRRRPVPDARCRARERLRVEIPQRHARAGQREPPGDRLADAGGAPVTTAVRPSKSSRFIVVSLAVVPRMVPSRHRVAGPRYHRAMGGGITRRDFLNGMAIAVVAGLSPAEILAAAPGRYPPAERGFKGSQPGSFDAAHALRDGKRWSLDGVAASETVDLCVVGGGLSGLATAYFWRRRRPSARILVLDAHADFGGHAHRNEFVVDGRTLVSYGGSESLQSPSTLWDDVAKDLIRELGVDLKRFDTAFDRALYPSLGLSRGVFFAREAFGEDRLVTGDPMRMVADDIPPDRMNARSAEAFVGDFPLPAEMRAKLALLYTSTRDPLEGRSLEEKEAILDRTSYRGLADRDLGPRRARRRHVLRPHARLLRRRHRRGVGARGLRHRLPGVRGARRRARRGRDQGDGGALHPPLPDGNASLARLMVRRLVPGVAPGTTMDDVVTARFDYDKLDRPGAPTRIRLDSTAVVVRNRDGGVDVGYVRDGKLARVRPAIA